MTLKEYKTGKKESMSVRMCQRRMDQQMGGVSKKIIYVLN